MGLYATSLADLALRQVGDYPEKPSATVREIPVVRAFVRDPDNPNTRYVTEFYDLLKKARRAELSMKAHEGDKADAYYEKHQKLIDAAPSLNQAARDLSATRRDTREIMESRDYSGEEKRRLVNEQNARIRAIAKGVMLEQPGTR